MTAKYDGKELRPYEGRPGANDHMKCGSLKGGKVVPYSPPKPILSRVKQK